jgi:hypothetical protein
LLDDKLFLSFYDSALVNNAQEKQEEEVIWEMGWMAAVEINLKMISFPEKRRREKVMELNHLLQLEISF